MSKRAWAIAVGVLAAGLTLSACTTTNRVESEWGNSPAEQGRKAEIMMEPVGDYYIGRRYHVERTRFWGYLRRPRQSWSTARMVVMNEDRKRVPDRLPERPLGAEERFSFDHNFEYRIYGRFSGNTVYDPNANLFLPEFVLTGYELINSTPGWLFKPDEVYNPKRVPWVPEQDRGGP